VRISCNDLMQIVAEMEEALPLYSIGEDLAEVVRHTFSGIVLVRAAGNESVHSSCLASGSRRLERLTSTSGRTHRLGLAR
jgi:hypothetical protein